ncbi:MAG: phospholipase D-like domain-containing protein [Candidatus Bathyarchaeota archaeon]|nr:phospholipase D-like domain-containing protein [Candidatus Bathyarchaeota archaeon]
MQREVYNLECKWPNLATISSATYVDMMNKLFSKGIAEELSTKEICIMTPYTDYEIEKYVSMIRTLITNGYTVRIICRLHQNRKRWKIFRDGLLKGLGDKSAAVKVHTYTRFKGFARVSQLKRESNDLRNEFGIHAKLFIIGDPSNGAVLLGSANLLENSFNWNPECGVYTEEPDFIKSAKTFFDFVWELSDKDSLDLSMLDRIPKGPFFPHFYQ